MKWLRTLREWITDISAAFTVHEGATTPRPAGITCFLGQRWELQRWQTGAWGRVGEGVERSVVISIQQPGLYRIIQYDYVEWGRGRVEGIPFQLVGETTGFVSWDGPVAVVGTP